MVSLSNESQTSGLCSNSYNLKDSQIHLQPSQKKEVKYTYDVHKNSLQ